MANRSCGNRRQQPVRSVAARRCAEAPTHTEPAVRRWPHPVDGTAPVQPGDPALHYIRCALSYQNQLLAEIKALLEKLTLGDAAGEK